MRLYAAKDTLLPLNCDSHTGLTLLINTYLEILPGSVTVTSVPQPFDALNLEVVAYTTDSSDNDCHRFDAVAWLVCPDPK